MTFSAIRVASSQGDPPLVGLGFMIRDERVINGGIAVLDTDNVRTVSTQIVNTISGAFLGVNEFTLPAGIYDVIGRAVINDIGRHRFILYNKTDAGIELEGFSEFDSPIGGFNSGGEAILRGRIDIAGAKTFEFRHYTKGGDTAGLGIHTGPSFSVFSTMHFLEV